MKPSVLILGLAVLAGGAALWWFSSAAPRPAAAPQTAPFPPPQGRSPGDPREILQQPDRGPELYQPTHPVMEWVDVSDGLPTSGTWLGYPALVDFDGDGRADLVASNREEDGYSVWRSTPGGWVLSNSGPGLDAEGKPEEGLPRDMAYGPACGGDVDGDGDVDLLLSAHTDALRIYLNVPAVDADGAPRATGALHWKRAPTAIENPFLMLDIAVGDVDGDGNLDVAGIAHFKGGLGVYLGDGAAGLRRLAESSSITASERTFGRDVELADLDGDGLDDIFLACSEGLRAYRTIRGESLTWESLSTGLPVPTIGNTITAICVGNFVGSPTLEVAFGLVPDPNVPFEDRVNLGVLGWNAEKRTWEHVGRGLPQREVYRGLAAGDFDADGRLDLLAISLKSGAVFWTGDGQGQFTARGRLPGDFNKGRLAVGDIDGDGLLDVVLAIPGSKDRPGVGGLRAWLNRPELWR